MYDNGDIYQTIKTLKSIVMMIVRGLFFDCGAVGHFFDFQRGGETAFP